MSASVRGGQHLPMLIQAAHAVKDGDLQKLTHLNDLVAGIQFRAGSQGNAVVIQRNKPQFLPLFHTQSGDIPAQGFRRGQDRLNQIVLIR